MVSWTNGIAIVVKIWPYVVSSDGWAVALKMHSPLKSKELDIRSGGMKLSAVSKHMELFTFTPLPSNPLWDLSGIPQDDSIELIFYFDNVELSDLQIIETSTVYYFKYYVSDVSCLLDRFDDYPL